MSTPADYSRVAAAVGLLLVASCSNERQNQPQSLMLLDDERRSGAVLGASQKAIPLPTEPLPSEWVGSGSPAGMMLDQDAKD